MDIHQLIIRYFDGTTTVDEERQLRQMLASDTYSGDDVDDARAVMGVFACKRIEAKRHASTPKRKFATVARAACLMALLAGGIYLYMHHSQQPDLVAYINGVEVSPDAALTQMQADLNLFSEVSADVSDAIADDFQSMSVIFE